MSSGPLYSSVLPQLQVLYDASPAAVGGKLPDDNFYYTEPSVLRKVMAAIRNSAK